MKINFFRSSLFLLIIFTINLNSCAAPAAQVKSDFYLGLLQEPPNSPAAIAYFEKALTESNEYIRAAAATELANMMYNGTQFSNKTIESIKLNAKGHWATAFSFRKFDIHEQTEALNFLLNFQQNEIIPNEARLYIIREFERNGLPFSEKDLAVINAHYAVSRVRYNEALGSFRELMEDDKWPESPPLVILAYPTLISDLGRAFQYTASGREGLDLFLEWYESVQKLEGGEDYYYPFVFFAARVARRRGLNEKALELFEQALQFAPDSEQKDACAWYILDMSLGSQAQVFLNRLERLIPYWTSCNYFYDVLEKYLHSLVSKKDWANLIKAYGLIKDRDTVIKAGYSWVIARIIEEDFLSQELLGQVYTITDTQNQDDAVKTLKRNTYDATGTVETPAAHYYRQLSANALELPFLILPKDTAAPAAKTTILNFLLGFFANNAIDQSIRYIRAVERDISSEELRAVSKAFENAGEYALAIRQVSRYVNRENHVRTREDLEILYPRPFKELTERYAALYDLSPSLLFSLIRTESAFQSSVVSHAGAIGLTQLMPATANDMANRIRRGGGTDYFDENRRLDLTNPELNISIGTYYFNYLLGRFDNTKLALMAYNGGQNRVRRWRAANQSLPVDLFLETIIFYETRDYGRKVIGAATVYEELYSR